MSNNPYQAATENFQSQAQGLGFRPNPYASPAQRMMDETRYMALMKDVLDQMYGSNNAWNRQFPQNPVMGMPFNMQNLFNSYGELAMNNPLMLPGGSAGMFQNGAYTPGALGGNMSGLLKLYLGGSVPSDTSQLPAAAAQIASANGLNQGGNPAGGGAAGGGGGPAAGPTPSAQSGLPEGRGVEGPTVPAISGANDIARQIPGIGALISSFENNTGDLLGRSGTSGGNPQGGGLPLISGVNDIARAALPGVGGVEDILGGLGNAVTGRGGGQQGAPAAGPGSNVTVNTAGGPFPRSMSILAQKFGVNAIPQGVNVNDFMDNILAGFLQNAGAPQGGGRP